MGSERILNNMFLGNLSVLKLFPGFHLCGSLHFGDPLFKTRVLNWGVSGGGAVIFNIPRWKGLCGRHATALTSKAFGFCKLLQQDLADTPSHIYFHWMETCHSWTLDTLLQKPRGQREKLNQDWKSCLWQIREAAVW